MMEAYLVLALMRDLSLSEKEEFITKYTAIHNQLKRDLNLKYEGNPDDLARFSLFAVSDYQNKLDELLKQFKRDEEYVSEGVQ